MTAALERLLVALPVLLVALGTFTTGHRSWPVLGLALAASVLVALAQSMRMQKRLFTIASVLAAYRDGDFSIRARSGGSVQLRDVLAELNGLGDVLRSHRLGELEAWTLLRKVMAEIDVVVLAVDDEGKVRLANHAARRVLGAAVGSTTADLGIADLVTGDAPRLVPLAAGEWELRRGAFRLAGEPQTLLVLGDVSRSLREKERDAWQKLIRVMSHEINNSLSPIASISESLVALVDPAKRDARDAEWDDDLAGGLGVIARRAEGLGRFVNGYARLARLPVPQRAPVHVPSLVRKIAALETRAVVEVADGPDVTVEVDGDQIEQVLINLVKNAVEANVEGAVRIGWEASSSAVALTIDDEGPGVSETKNLFVPFFTTKPEGSGIGLVLSRQIVEAHEGQLTLASRPEGPGARATVSLPLPAIPSRATTP